MKNLSFKNIIKKCPASGENMEKKTILLVEDQVLTAMSESQIINSNGFNVITASNGNEAIYRIKENDEISLVLMDINLGDGISGTDAAVEILKFKEIPIVFLTSHSEKEMVEKVKDITRYGYVLKNSGEFVLIESINMAYELFEINQKLKNSEAQSREKREHYQIITEMTTDYYVKLSVVDDKDIVIDFVSDNFYRITGRSVDDMKKMSSWDSIFYQDDLAEFKEFVTNLIRTGSEASIECRTNIKGVTRWVSIVGNPQRDKVSGKVTVIYGAVKDISDRKQSSIKLSEKKCNNLLDKLNMGIFMSDLNGKFLHVNSYLVDMAGYETIDEMMDNPIQSLYYNLNERIDIFEKISEDSYLKDFEMEMVKKDGTLFWASLSAVILKDEIGNAYTIFGTVSDITERKNMEKALLLYGQQLKESQQLAKIGNWIWDITDKKLIWSDEVYRIFEVVPEEFIPSVESFENFIHPEDKDEFLRQRSQMLDEKKDSCIDHRILLPYGKIKHIQERARLITDESGDVIRVIGTVQDITERKETELALISNEEKFKNLVENLNDIVFSLDPAGTVIYVSPRLSAVTGFSPDDLVGSKFYNFISPDDLPDIKKSFGLVLKGSIRSSDFRYITKNGQIHWARTSSRPILENGIVTGVNGILSDITEKKLYEEALLKSEVHLSNALKIAHLGPWEYDVLKDEFTFNDSFYAIYKTTAKDVGGYKMSSSQYSERFMFPEDRHLIVSETKQALESNDPDFSRQTEHRILYADGQIGYISVRFYIIKDEHGKTIKTYGVNQDITERKKVENEILRLLDERDLLLTEVHHRIKNDMNIICSMLMIQIDSCDNPVIRNVLMETEVRINVMFNIYNELYMGKEFNFISLKTYITNLISNIKYIYSDQCNTVMNIDIDDITISRKISFPVGMIVNELITNSYKYAFVDRISYDNSIGVIMHKNGNGDFFISISDNGKGFPDRILRNELPGFGLKLINMLSRQINGKTKLYNDNGAKFELFIKAENT